MPPTITKSTLDRLHKEGLIDEAGNFVDKPQVVESDDAEKKALQAKVAALESEKKQEEEAKRKATLKVFQSDLYRNGEKTAEDLARTKFSNQFVPEELARIMQDAKSSFASVDLSKWADDKIDGLEKAGLEFKSHIYQAMESFHKLLVSSGRNRARLPITENFNMNTLSKPAVTRGALAETAYGSDAKAGERSGQELYNTAILSKMYNMQVGEEGRDLLESRIFAPYANDIKAFMTKQKHYTMTSGIAENHIMSPSGLLFQNVNSDAGLKMIFESDQTTTGFVGGKTKDYTPIDIQEPLIMHMVPLMLGLKIAASKGIMTKNTKRIYEIEGKLTNNPRRQGRHYFGLVDHAALTSLAAATAADGTVVTDEGSLTYPDEIYGVVCETIATNTTITLTATTSGGDTTTLTAQFLTTDSVGATKRFTSAVAGDKIVDITGVSATSLGANGQVAFFAQDPITGHVAGSAAQRTNFKMLPHDINESTYDLQTSLTQDLIDDITNSLGDIQGFDGLALFTEMLSEEIVGFLNKIVINKCMTAAHADNVVTMYADQPASGYTPKEWRSRLRYYMDQLGSNIKLSSNRKPNWHLWSEYDVAEYKDWLGIKESEFSIQKNDPFANNEAKFEVNGGKVYSEMEVPTQRIISGSSDRNSGLHYYTYVPLKIIQGQDATAGMAQVFMAHHRAAIAAPTGYGIGYLKVIRNR